MRQWYNREKQSMDIQTQEAGLLCQPASSHKTAKPSGYSTVPQYKKKEAGKKRKNNKVNMILDWKDIFTPNC